MQKKGRYYTFLILLVTMLFAGSFEASASTKTPELNTKKVTLEAGKSTTLKVKHTKGKIKWSSSNKKVAVVNRQGKVTAKKQGKATISARVGKKTLRCKVTVAAKKKAAKIKFATIAELRKAYPRTKKGKDKALSYVQFSLTWSEANAIRNNIYKTIGVSKANLPQYNCWLIANYVCRMLTYTSMNEASFLETTRNGRCKEGDPYCTCNAIYSLYLGEGVCANYAQVMEWLLNGCGVTNVLGCSDGHIWNQVKIDGKWYNIDATWGDAYNFFETNGIVHYMGSGQFLTSDFLHLMDNKLENIHARKCKSERFTKYQYSTVPPTEGRYSLFEVDGITYYSPEDIDAYWLTDKWKTL